MRARPGDLITFAPSWIDPVGRLHLGEHLSLEDAGRADAARYARVWVLSIRDASSADVAGERPALTSRLDGILVRRYDRTAAVIVEDAVRSLPTAQVTGDVASGPQVVLAEVGFTPRRCVQVVPAAGGAVRITFPRFALGSQLVAYAGLADVFTRRDIREPGRLELELAGQVIAARELGVDDGWVRLQARTTPGVAELTVIARAPSPRAHRRQICFAVESRR